MTLAALKRTLCEKHYGHRFADGRCSVCGRIDTRETSSLVAPLAIHSQDWREQLADAIWSDIFWGIGKGARLGEICARWPGYKRHIGLRQRMTRRAARNRAWYELRESKREKAQFDIRFDVGKSIVIPLCYSKADDLDRIAARGGWPDFEWRSKHVVESHLS